MNKLIQFLSAHPFILGDGAMGTMLQQVGLTTGGAPEEWNVARPDVIMEIYQGYVAAGAQIITTNSFGGTRYRLGRENLQDHVAEFNLAAARLARKVAAAADHEVLVAGDIGPTGEILFPLGTVTAEEARDAFTEQAAALAEGGVDFFLIETMSALDEVQAAIEGIRAASDLPIAVTMTFDTRGRTMMGVKPAQAVQALYDWGIRVMGANCGNGPAETEATLAQMAAIKPADVYLMAQSNAGLPKYVDKKIRYDGTPEVMAAYALRMKELGVSYIGACCGSTPEHIAAMRQALEQG
ncbi:MAG: betaine--homocysteine S-methyltransferase [Chloroflexi bacterium]|nr:betaine--homocysteine S-methyltransferase [Chloroflexota bacterium]